MKDIIAIVGPTGVGKSKLSVELAKEINAEIISGDAYQVYRHMDIGTAKIKEDEMQGIKHYLVDCLNIDDDYNVKVFQEQARKIIDDILSRDKKVIICGGTGLYIKALLYDYVFEDECFDEAYHDYLCNLTNEELWTKLLEVDHETSSNLHPNNRKRIIRALEMAHQGNKKSERLAKQEHQMIYDATIIGLTRERTNLYDAINKRVDKMFEEGLLEEVQNILNKGYSFELNSMKAIGYKEFKPYFESECSLEEVCEKIKKNTRNFAKRQYTWFNNQLCVHWIDIEKNNSLVEAQKIIREDDLVAEK